MRDLADVPPLPPVELRRMVGPVDEESWRNDSGMPFRHDLPIFRSEAEARRVHERVLDFGCGAGRLAIRLLMQEVRPKAYLGVDVSRPMIDWCKANLTPYCPSFRFEHHDVWSPIYAPENSRGRVAPLPAEADTFSLSIAHSVFTHLYEDQAMHYLAELATLTEPDGLIYCTWLFFNREAFPMLASHQHNLFISNDDPTQAVYFDWEFFRKATAMTGLKIVWVDWSPTPGFQTEVFLCKGDRYPDIGHRLVPPATVIGY